MGNEVFIISFCSCCKTIENKVLTIIAPISRTLPPFLKRVVNSFVGSLFSTNQQKRRQSCGGEEIKQSFEITEDFISAQLGLAVNAIDECNRNFTDGEALLTSSDDHLHLEYVSFRHARIDELFQHLLLSHETLYSLKLPVRSEAPGRRST